MEAGNEPEHDKDEEQAGNIEGRHQFAKREHAADAVFTNGESHCAKRPDRRYLHNDTDNAEKHMGDLLYKIEYQRPPTAECVQGESEHEREQQNLQYLPLGE